MNEKNNYQDNAETREYNKGYRAGSNKKNRSRKKTFKKESTGTNQNGRRIFPIRTDSTDNDASWYTPNNVLLKDFASYASNFSTSNGIPLFTGASGANGIDSIPGVVAYDIIPVFPDDQSQTSPLYQSAVMLWESIQSKNSRTPDFEPGDIFMFLVAVSNAYAAYMEAVRIYGVATLFNMTNAYWPNAILEAMNVDAHSVQSQLANYRGQLNLIALQLAQIPLPKSIDYTTRMIFLNQNIYTDSKDITSATLWVPNMLGYYQYVEGDSSNPISYLSLLPKSSTGNKRTVSDILGNLNNLLAPLYSSEDIHMMGTTLLQAYGANSMFAMNPIAENFQIIPVYNPEVSMQFENAYVCYPADPARISATLKQVTEINTGYFNFSLSYVPKFDEAPINTVFNAANYLNYAINHHTTDLTPEQMIVATRLASKPIFSGTAVSTNIGVTGITSTEIVAGARVIIIGTGTSKVLKTYQLYTDIVLETTTVGVLNTPMYYIQALGALSKLDWHFKVNLWNDTDGSDLNAHFIASFIDYDRYTLISQDQLDYMNRMAMFGLFTPKQLPDILTVK